MARKKADPKKGTGKKPKGSGRRLYTDENPKDTVSIKFATPTDARKTVTKVRKLKKKLVTGAISKFDGHVFTFDFSDRKTASLKNFYQENEISDDDLNCEFEGVLGTTASIVGTTQANEALKMIMKIGQTLKNQILIIDLLNLNFRKVKFNRK